MGVSCFPDLCALALLSGRLTDVSAGFWLVAEPRSERSAPAVPLDFFAIRIVFFDSFSRYSPANIVRLTPLWRRACALRLLRNHAPKKGNARIDVQGGEDVKEALRGGLQ